MKLYVPLTRLIRNGAHVSGILLAIEFHDRKWKVVSLVSSGGIFRNPASDVMFVVPALVRKDLIARAGTEIVSSDDAETAARVQILKVLRKFEKMLDASVGAIGRLNMKTLCDRVSSPDPEKWNRMTLPEVVSILCPEEHMSPATSWAVHTMLMRSPLHFVADPLNYFTTQRLYVRPRQHVREIEAIDEMRRAGSFAIDAFVSRAQQVMAASRKRAIESSSQFPSKKVNSHEVFNQHDVTILGFLLHAFLPHRLIQGDPYQNGLSYILKKLAPKVDRINHT